MLHVEELVGDLSFTDDFDYNELRPPMIDIPCDELSNVDSVSPHVQGTKLKALPDHLKYVYLKEAIL